MNTTYAISKKDKDIPKHYEIHDLRAITVDGQNSALSAAIQDIKRDKRFMKSLSDKSAIFCLQGEDITGAVFDKETKTFNVLPVSNNIKEHLLPRIRLNLLARHEFAFLVSIEKLKRLDAQDKKMLKELGIEKNDISARIDELQELLVGKGIDDIELDK